MGRVCYSKPVILNTILMTSRLVFRRREERAKTIEVIVSLCECGCIDVFNCYYIQ